MSADLGQLGGSDLAVVKEITFGPAFDRRDPDPSKNYGIHGVEIRWLYKGALGATQFLLYTGWHLPHIEKDMEENWPRDRIGFRITRPTPADLGYHSPVPQYEGQDKMECDVLPGGECYYDGSGLNARPVYERLVAEGGDAVWDELASYYSDLFMAAKGMIQQLDVIRARRYGNKTAGNYVIDQTTDSQPVAGGFACYAHRQFGAKANKGHTDYMVFHVDSIRVIRRQDA